MSGGHTNAASRTLGFGILRVDTATQLTVSGIVWEECVADPAAHVRVVERFDQMRFTCVRQCPVPGAHVFIVG